jgi:hypothetical protein
MLFLNINSSITKLSSNYCFQNKKAAKKGENPLANKSSKKKLKKLKAHILFF